MFTDITRKQTCNPQVTPQIPCIQLGWIQYGDLLMPKLLRKHKTKPSCNQSATEDVRALWDKFTSAKHVLNSDCERELSNNFWQISGCWGPMFSKFF